MNRERVAFTLDHDVNNNLKKLIKPRERSNFVNSILQRALKKQAVRELNSMIDSIHPVTPIESSTKIVREIREDGRMKRLLANHSGK